MSMPIRVVTSRPWQVLWLLVCLLTAAVAEVAHGQYPRIPEDVRIRSEAEKAAADRRSDEAFARALPEIEAWAAKGKPFLQGVSRPDQLPQATIPAFPGAEGAGRHSFGGRGGKVMVVTSLHDSGPGTFREACEAGGPRVVVFNVAGIIRLKDRIRIRAPYITIDGSSAPGDGVCIAGNTVELDTHDVVIRHMRFRRGATDVGDRNDSIGGNPIGNSKEEWTIKDIERRPDGTTSHEQDAYFETAKKLAEDAVGANDTRGARSASTSDAASR